MTATMMLTMIVVIETIGVQEKRHFNFFVINCKQFSSNWKGRCRMNNQLTVFSFRAFQLPNYEAG